MSRNPPPVTRNPDANFGKSVPECRVRRIFPNTLSRKKCEAFRKLRAVERAELLLGESVSSQSSPLPACQPLPTRRFLGNRFVYCVLSQRAGGLSVGINMNPDKLCNFDCIYCEVDRTVPGKDSTVSVSVMLTELEGILARVLGPHAGRLEGFPADLPFREVALSGDGEPTLAPNFQEITEAVTGLRVRQKLPFFKIVLITNGSGLHLPRVRAGLDALSGRDEIWVKLDCGTPEAFERINRPGISLDHLLENILDLGRRRAIVIQSLFPLVEGVGPSDPEITAYVERLKHLRDAGARIAQVQVYSAHRPAMNAACTHLPLRALSGIVRQVREAGIPAEVF